MKQKLLSIALLAFTSLSAYPSIGVIRGVPTMKAQMNVTEANMGFKNIADPELSLISDNGVATGLMLEYDQPANAPGDSDQTNAPTTKVRQLLEIVDTRDIGCGSVAYTAQLKNEIDSQSDQDTDSENDESGGGRNRMGVRFSIDLVDHTSRICRDYKPYRWLAEVRSGFGWCGTMDATMKLRGNPVPVQLPELE